VVISHVCLTFVCASLRLTRKCMMKEPSSCRFYGIPEDGFIGGENNKTMGNGLADQHAVKGVFVIRRL
jgi:hypothetical protein